MINDCHLLAWEKRQPFWATFVRGCEAGWEEETFPTSLPLCDQKWAGLILVVSANMGKVCEDFIMNQSKVLKIMFIISYC